MTRTSVVDPRLTAFGLLAQTVTGLSGRFAIHLAQHGVSAAEFEVLLRLARASGGALRMTDLAAQTQLTTSGITRVVDRLERGGLVRRRACSTDRRGFYAHVTEAGLDRLDQVLPGHLAMIERWFTSRLAPTELAMLLDLLRVIQDG